MTIDHPPQHSPEREFAVDVVTKLRDAGYDALWAGGCVRDELLGITPKDFDVATNATPHQVIQLFGKRKTVPVGVSFGVVMVLGPNKRCGQIEVATFRADGEYLDGRRPSAIQFCSAEEDAKRRDFTINGMFYDPVTQQVIDYVNGRQDLQQKVVRAIGTASARFIEDKLRMLRAVRFAATYQFELDNETSHAISDLAAEISHVSMERITQELRRMLAHETRAASTAGLLQVGLLRELFPQFDYVSNDFAPAFAWLQNILTNLAVTRFEPAFAALVSLPNPERLRTKSTTQDVTTECQRFKMSNEESQCIGWLTTAAADCESAATTPFHVIKPIVVDSRFPLLLDLLQAIDSRQADANFLRNFRQQTADDILDPDPLIDGRILKDLGIEPGPEFKRILTVVRNEQLDELLQTKQEAIVRAGELSNIAPDP